MAEQQTPRLGLTTWSEDTDKHPGRTGTNTIHQTLDSKVVVFVPKGLLSARPAAGVQGRFFLATNQGDTGRLYYDDGVSWVELNNNGGGGTPPPPDIGGPGTEGTSQRAMRADARPPLDLATASNHGAMPSQFAEMLEKATSAATPNTVAMRGSGGQLTVAAPSATSHAVTKAYADAIRADMPYGSRFAEPHAWISRDAGGRGGYVNDPVEPLNIANKRYVDTKASRAEWKTDVEALGYGLDEVVELVDRGISWWRYREDSPYQGEGLGPMVAEVADVMPRLTTTGEDGKPERVRDRDFPWVLAQAVAEVEQRRELDEALIDHLIKRTANQAQVQVEHEKAIRRLNSTVKELVRIVNDLSDQLREDD